MFTLITGTPGAGKTAYTVWEVIRPTVGVVVKDTAGTEHTRRILTNVKGLTIPHEVIGAAELETWPDWCKPGDLIVFDEVQEVWRPRTLGTKVPPAIAALETHRHLGVDIVVITQHPGLVDSNVRKLVNQHIHLRRLTNAYAYRYEWDACSDNVKATKSCVHSGLWRRPKQVHDLYRSAMLHTKPKSRLPALAYVLPVALLGMAGLGSVAYGRISSRFDDPAKASAQAVQPSLILPEAQALAPDSQPAAPDAAPVSSDAGEQLGQGLQVEAVPAVSSVGCIVMADKCGCYSDGRPVEPDPNMCAALMGPSGRALELLPEPRLRVGGIHDGEVIVSMRAR